MSLVNFDSRTPYLDKDYNFWEYNPQIASMKPFSQLYTRDLDPTIPQSKSSKEMTMVIFLADADESRNRFYRIPLKERIQMLQETYFEDFDPNDTLIQECIDAYPHACLSAIERALKDEIDSMVQRAKLFKTPYTLSEHRIITTSQGSQKVVKVPGTASELDAMRARTPKLYENYDKLKEQFLEQQKVSRVRGGRKLTEREKGLL